MYTQTALSRILPSANLTLVSGAISAMNSSQVCTQIAFGCKLLAANLALVFGVRMLRSWCQWRFDVAVSMRRVVVSADRWLVAERHLADLTLSNWRPCLNQTKTLCPSGSEKRGRTLGQKPDPVGFFFRKTRVFSNPWLPEVEERKLHKHGPRFEPGFIGRPTTRPLLYQLSQPSSPFGRIHVSYTCTCIWRLSPGDRLFALSIDDYNKTLYCTMYFHSKIQNSKYEKYQRQTHTCTCMYVVAQSFKMIGEILKQKN